jgi:hypothetical protein
MKTFITNYGAVSLIVFTITALAFVVIHNCIVYGYHNPIASF